MSEAKSLAEKDSYLMVEFVYGDPAAPQYARYTDSLEAVGPYLSQPDMEVKLPENTGSFGEAEMRIELPIDAFTGPLASGLAHSPVFVSVLEVTRPLTAGPAGSNLMLFRGRIVRTIRNAEGRSDSARLLCQPLKARLDVALGLPANHHCVWTLFGRGCGLLEATYRQTCQIASISGKVVTITTPNGALTAPTSPGGNVDRFWERGFMRKDGLQIGIHLWTLAGTPSEFVLRSRPPATWLMAGPTSITIVPGCHKHIEDCRDVWDRESNFNGFGYAVPPYNPIFENPT